MRNSYTTDDLFSATAACFLISTSPDELLPVRYRTRTGEHRVKVLMKWGDVEQGLIDQIESAKIPLCEFRRIYFDLRKHVMEIVKSEILQKGQKTEGRKDEYKQNEADRSPAVG